LQSAPALSPREKAERAYQTALEDSMKSLERLEAEISLASNTKVSIKEIAKALEASFREMVRTGKVIGMVRTQSRRSCVKYSTTRPNIRR